MKITMEQLAAIRDRLLVAVRDHKACLDAMKRSGDAEAKQAKITRELAEGLDVYLKHWRNNEDVDTAAVEYANALGAGKTLAGGRA